MTRVIALHGNLGGPGDWEAVQTRLAPDISITALSLWPFAAQGLTLRETASRILDLAADLPGETRPLLAGYSLGGRIALACMELQPEGLAGAVLLSTHPGLKTESDRAKRRTVDLAWSEKITRLSPADFWREWNEQPVFQSPSDPIPDALVDHTAEISAAFRLWSLGCQPDYAPFLAASAIPALWLTGAEDEKFTALARGLSGPLLQTKSIPHTGHRLLAVAPDKIAAAITAFLPSCR